MAILVPGVDAPGKGRTSGVDASHANDLLLEPRVRPPATDALKFTARDAPSHPGVELRANRKSISHRCYLFEVAFVWELVKEAIHLPLGCLQGGVDAPADPCAESTSGQAAAPSAKCTAAAVQTPFNPPGRECDKKAAGPHRRQPLRRSVRLKVQDECRGKTFQISRLFFFACADRTDATSRLFRNRVCLARKRAKLCDEANRGFFNTQILPVGGKRAEHEQESKRRGSS